MSLFSNMLSRLVIAFLPRSKCLNFMAAVTICSHFGAQNYKVSHWFHCFPSYLPWSDGTRCHDLRFVNIEFWDSFFTLLFQFPSLVAQMVKHPPAIWETQIRYLGVFAWNVPLISLIFLKRSLVFPIILFSSISDHWGRLSYLSLLFFGTLHSDGISFPSSFAFRFSSFLSYLQGLPRPPFCTFAFLSLGDGLDHCLLHSVTNLHP